MSSPAVLMLLACAVFAVSAIGEPEVVDPDLQRRRIDAVRKEKLAELAELDAACLSRFAVTDCQNKVGVRRREMLAELKRQEAQLNEVDRLQKGTEQIRRSQNKASERAQRESEVQTIPKGETLEDRQKILDDKVLNHGKQEKQATPAAPVNKTASGLDARSMQNNREAYAEKQRAAEQRRLDREKRLLEKANGSAPLPRAP
jgi:hypothetical protein